MTRIITIASINKKQQKLTMKWNPKPKTLTTLQQAERNKPNTSQTCKLIQSFAFALIFARGVPSFLQSQTASVLVRVEGLFVVLPRFLWHIASCSQRWIQSLWGLQMEVKNVSGNCNSGILLHQLCISN